MRIIHAHKDVCAPSHLSSSSRETALYARITYSFWRAGLGCVCVFVGRLAPERSENTSLRAQPIAISEPLYFVWWQNAFTKNKHNTQIGHKVVLYFLFGSHDSSDRMAFCRDTSRCNVIPVSVPCWQDFRPLLAAESSSRRPDCMQKAFILSVEVLDIMFSDTSQNHAVFCLIFEHFQVSLLAENRPTLNGMFSSELSSCFWNNPRWSDHRLQLLQSPSCLLASLPIPVRWGSLHSVPWSFPNKQLCFDRWQNSSQTYYIQRYVPCLLFCSLPGCSQGAKGSNLENPCSFFKTASEGGRQARSSMVRQYPEAEAMRSAVSVSVSASMMAHFPLQNR